MDRFLDEDGEPRSPVDQRLLGGAWKLHPSPSPTPPPLCAECQRPMALRVGAHLRNQEAKRPFWGCTGYPACRGAHGAHPNGEPLGVPGDKPTREARARAHEAFDRIWRAQHTRLMSRDEAYGWMARELGLSRDECHIARFDEETCARLIRAVYVLFVERGLADPNDQPIE